MSGQSSSKRKQNRYQGSAWRDTDVSRRIDEFLSGVGRRQRKIVLTRTRIDRRTGPSSRTVGLLWSQTVPHQLGAPTIVDVRSRDARPGPKKVQRLPIGSRRTCLFIQSIDYSWRELFEKADVVSEGAVRDEPDGPVYYGSTSVLLATFQHGGRYSEGDRDEVLQLLSADPHARVRAVRIACLEAQLRARRSIGAVRAELTIRRDARGVRIDIDVEARVTQELMSRETRATTNTHRNDRHR